MANNKDETYYCLVCKSKGVPAKLGVSWYNHVEGKKHVQAFRELLKETSLERFRKENGSHGVPCSYLPGSEIGRRQKFLFNHFKDKMPPQMTQTLKNRYCAFIRRSGRELNYKCKLCARDTNDMVGWIFHIFDILHTMVCFTKIKEIGIAEYFSKYRNIPGPCCIHFDRCKSWAPTLPPYLQPGIQGTIVAEADPGITQGNNLVCPRKPVNLDPNNKKRSLNKTQTPKSNLKKCSTRIMKDVTVVTSLKKESSPPIEPQFGENLKFQEGNNDKVTQCTKKPIKSPVKTKKRKKRNLSNHSTKVTMDVTMATSSSNESARPVPQFGETIVKTLDKPVAPSPLHVNEQQQQPLYSEPFHQPCMFTKGEPSKSTMKRADGSECLSSVDPRSSVKWTYDDWRRGCSETLHNNLTSISKFEQNSLGTSDWIVRDAVFNGSVADEEDSLMIDNKVRNNVPEESDFPDTIFLKANESAKEKLVGETWKRSCYQKCASNDIDDNSAVRLMQQRQSDSGHGSDEFVSTGSGLLKERSVKQKGTKRKSSREESGDRKRTKCDDSIEEIRLKKRSCNVDDLDSAKQEAQARLEQLVKCLRVSNSTDSDSLMKFGDLLDPDDLLQVLNPGFLDSVNKLCELLEEDKDTVRLKNLLHPSAVQDEGMKELLQILDMDCEL